MRVFVSHANEDRSAARVLTEEMTQAGIDVWNPYQDLDPGDNIAMKVGQALDRSDFMVIIWSSHSGLSKSVRNEIDYALSSQKYQGRLSTVVIDDKKTLPWVLANASSTSEYPNNKIEFQIGDFRPVVEKLKNLEQLESNAT